MIRHFYQIFGDIRENGLETSKTTQHDTIESFDYITIQYSNQIKTLSRLYSNINGILTLLIDIGGKENYQRQTFFIYSFVRIDYYYYSHPFAFYYIVGVAATI